MAEQLETFEFRRPAGQNQFDSLLDGSIWSIALDDFPTYNNFKTLRSALYLAAKSKGLSLRSAIKDDRLVVQANKENGAS